MITLHNHELILRLTKIRISWLKNDEGKIFSLTRILTTVPLQPKASMLQMSYALLAVVIYFDWSILGLQFLPLGVLGRDLLECQVSFLLFKMAINKHWIFRQINKLNGKKGKGHWSKNGSANLTLICAHTDKTCSVYSKGHFTFLSTSLCWAPSPLTK